MPPEDHRPPDQHMRRAKAGDRLCHPPPSSSIERKTALLRASGAGTPRSPCVSARRPHTGSGNSPRRASATLTRAPPPRRPHIDFVCRLFSNFARESTPEPSFLRTRWTNVKYGREVSPKVCLHCNDDEVIIHTGFVIYET